MFRLSIPLILILVAFFGCKKDEPVFQKSGPGGEVYSKAALDFKLFANGTPLLDSTLYTNAQGDSFSVNRFNYYISNIKLTRADGFVYHEKDVYRLVKHMDGEESFIMENVPTGKYSKMEFLIGVDSLRNVSGIQDGALDPVHNMFWDWNSGYIFFKMEGRYRTNTQQFIDDYAIHIGGFKPPHPCLQTASLTFDTLLNIKTGRVPTINIGVTADEVFKRPHDIGFDYYYSHITLETFREVSENYRDMFSVRHMEN
jgi:hypothetical protein